MDLLPTPHERSALLEALARLVDRQGLESFLRAPLLEPLPRFFPDRWEPTRRGVRLLCLRLLRYAGLEDVDASVEMYEEAGGEGQHHGTAAWFAGIDDDVCRFGVDKRQLEVEDAVVGTMCHEIAHAYRAHHDLAGPHGQLEEEDTDVTTIFLGFGILTTNNAYRFRSSGGLSGGMVTSKWQVSHTGYLSPQSMAFLLAAQVVARGLTKADAKRIGGHLETNQRAFFLEAHRELSQDVDALRIALGVPAEELWPSERQLALPSLPELEDDDEDEDEGEERPWNAGGTVFRVRQSRARAWGVRGMVVGTLVGSVVELSGDSFRWAVFFGAAAGGLLLGMVVGSLLRPIDHCSEPRCEGSIPVDGRGTCPKCGGSIAGSLRAAEDRLEVEEALEDGKPLAEIMQAIDRRARSKRVKHVVVLAVLVGLVVVLFNLEKIPRPATINTARQFNAAGVTVRLTGEIVARDESPTTLRRDDEELASFTIADRSGTLEIWHDATTVGREVRKGRHARLWGHFVSVSIRKENGESEDDRIFVATSLSVDD